MFPIVHPMLPIYETSLLMRLPTIDASEDRDDSTAPLPSPTPPTGRWTVVPSRSTAEFHASAFAGLDRVRGSMSVVDGEVEVDPAGRVVTLRATVDAASVVTGRRRRDTDLRSRHFLHTDDHPVLGYTSTEVERTTNGWLVRGHLTVRGSAVPLNLRVTAGPAPDRATAWIAHGEGELDLTPTAVGGRPLVGRRVRIVLEATLLPPRSREQCVSGR